MTLLEIITRHESAQPAPITLTPRGRAQVAGSRFARALRELTPEDRQYLLAQVVARADAGTEGRGFALLVSYPPVRDPQPA